jgi:DNA replication protein DnaC
MIDRLVHHGELQTFTGKSYRTRERNLETLPSEKPENKTQ